MHASEAERKQLELYALAASHDQASLAKEASEGLYAYPPDALTDDLARQMGAIYLRRLLGLRLARVDALKRIVITGPSAHAPTAACGPAQAQALERAWTLAAMSLGTEARADTSREEMTAAFAPLSDGLECSMCAKGLEDRIRAILYHWSLVKTTI